MEREPRPAAVLELSGVTKQYGALRPLRIERLQISPGESVALIGLDRPAAEVFINLITGASLPDTGVVTIFGRPTGDITDSTDWLTTLDRFGIVSERAVLLDGLSVIQNLAVPFSLDIEPPQPDVRERAVVLAQEVGLAERLWNVRIADLGAIERVRVRLARALAMDPSLLILEHPSATLEGADAPSLAADVRAIADRRGAATITLTMDAKFAAASSRVLTLQPATGRLTEGRFGRIRFWS